MEPEQQQTKPEPTQEPGLTPNDHRLFSDLLYGQDSLSIHVRLACLGEQLVEAYCKEELRRLRDQVLPVEQTKQELERLRDLVFPARRDAGVANLLYHAKIHHAPKQVFDAMVEKHAMVSLQEHQQQVGALKQQLDTVTKQRDGAVALFDDYTEQSGSVRAYTLLRKERDLLRLQLQDSESAHTTTKLEQAQLHQQLLAVTKERDVGHHETEHWRHEYDELERWGEYEWGCECEQLVDDLKETEAQLATVTEERDSLRLKHEITLAELEAAKTACDELMAERDKLHVDVARLESNQNQETAKELEQANARHDREKKDLVDELVNASRAAKSWRRKYAELDDERNKLRDEVARLQSNQSDAVFVAVSIERQKHQETATQLGQARAEMATMVSADDYGELWSKLVRKEIRDFNQQLAVEKKAREAIAQELTQARENEHKWRESYEKASKRADALEKRQYKEPSDYVVMPMVYDATKNRIEPLYPLATGKCVTWAGPSTESEKK